MRAVLIKSGNGRLCLFDQGRSVAGSVSMVWMIRPEAHSRLGSTSSAAGLSVADFISCELFSDLLLIGTEGRLAVGFETSMTPLPGELLGVRP